jgi:hypothetical protein
MAVSKGWQLFLYLPFLLSARQHSLSSFLLFDLFPKSFGESVPEFPSLPVPHPLSRVFAELLSRLLFFVPDDAPDAHFSDQSVNLFLLSELHCLLQLRDMTVLYLQTVLPGAQIPLELAGSGSWIRLLKSKQVVRLLGAGIRPSQVFKPELFSGLVQFILNF